MAHSHFEGGLRQRTWLSQGEEEAETNFEEIRARLEDGVELVEKGFSPSGIKPLEGAPDDVIEAASGESIEEVDLDRVAEYLAAEKWNYTFDADISEAEADVGVDEARIDLWRKGSAKVLATYNDPEGALKAVEGIKRAYPDTELEFDGTVYSRKPQDAQERYEEAVRLKREALVEEVNENPEELAEKLTGKNTDDIPELDGADVSPVLEVGSEFVLKSFLENRKEGEAEYDRIADEAGALVAEDAFERFQEAGIQLDNERGFDSFESYSEIVESVRQGKNSSRIYHLQDSDGNPMRMSLYAEKGRDINFSRPSQAGYQLEVFDQEGFETLADFYGTNSF